MAARAGELLATVVLALGGVALLSVGVQVQHGRGPLATPPPSGTTYESSAALPLTMALAPPPPPPPSLEERMAQYLERVAGPPAYMMPGPLSPWFDPSLWMPNPYLPGWEIVGDWYRVPGWMTGHNQIVDLPLFIQLEPAGHEIDPALMHIGEPVVR